MADLQPPLTPQERKALEDVAKGLTITPLMRERLLELGLVTRRMVGLALTPEAQMRLRTGL